jgi:glycosyltransferase involved in cell wall biosynthesis
MISFIIIGLNEGWKLTKCLQSVFYAIEQESIIDYEIIYVDSKSTDDSLQRAKVYNEVRIFQIKGECSAAIARNIGSIESSGEVLVFLDGDMELVPSFLSKVLDSDKKLRYDCVSGHLDDLLYDNNGALLKQRPVTYSGYLPDFEMIIKENGGFFIIKKALWQRINGMRTKYFRSEDFDLILRLSNIGVNTIRVPYLMVLHHTVDYRNELRMWRMLLSGGLNYYSLFFRDHFFNSSAFRHTVRNNYTAFFLAVIIVMAVINTQFLAYSLAPYLLILFLRALVNTRNTVASNKISYFFSRILYQLLRDIWFWIAFAFFYPNSPEIDYVKIDYSNSESLL